ncbi:TRAM domain-containing protein [bacterium]|nr:TRAM domain-containing protein [bacterium]
MVAAAVLGALLLPEQVSKVDSAREEISASTKEIERIGPERQKAYDELTRSKEDYDRNVDPVLLEPFTSEFAHLKFTSKLSTHELLMELKEDPLRLVNYDELEKLNLQQYLPDASGRENSDQTGRNDEQESEAADSAATRELLRQYALRFIELRDKDYVFTQVENEYSKYQMSVTINEEVVRVTSIFIFQINLLSLAMIFICTIVGYLTHPIAEKLIRRVTNIWKGMDFGPGQRSGPAAIGMFAGVVLATITLLMLFAVIPPGESFLDKGWFKLVIGTAMILIMGGIGAITGATYFGPREDPDEIDEFAEFRRNAAPKLLDTSVIIDGRIYEIAQTRFLDGYLVVTGSVLRELQTLADSADERKRIKGRSGLELVQKMQDDNRVDLRIFDDSQFDSQGNGVDDQLMIVCREMGAQVVTNDYNLNRVAAILNVKVLNINALANSVKTRHLPGDELVIKITDRGKQKGQGVGYLEDGTMVVIEDGGGYIGQNKLVRITSVSQTAQGRLLFARVDLASGDGDA